MAFSHSGNFLQFLDRKSINQMFHISDQKVPVSAMPIQVSAPIPALASSVPDPPVLPLPREHSSNSYNNSLTIVSVIQCSKKFVKIKVDNTQVRFSLLKNAKKLKGKKFSTYNNVLIGDDVMPRVRIVRKELLGIRKCLVDKGVECWVPPTLPPVICVKINNTVAKVLWYNAKDLLIP